MLHFPTYAQEIHLPLEGAPTGQGKKELVGTMSLRGVSPAL